MEIRSRLEGRAAVIELSGRLTVNDRPGALKDAVAAAISRGAADVLIDLAGVRYIDSTRLGELIAAHVTVSRHGGRLKLVRTPDRVNELLALSGLTDVFDRFDSVDAALASPRP